LIIHKGEIKSGRIERGKTVRLGVDSKKRTTTASNNTATHLLHYALRQVLGDHVKQAGSLVAPDRFRFDFTHFSQVDSESLETIEILVNERIRENISVEIEEMDAEDALKSGATALFEEKYGDRVRVISLGSFSQELCGGTHAKRTGDAGFFKILGESSIASGVRRIEAMTGASAVLASQQTERVLRETARLLKDKPETVYHRVEKMLVDYKSMEKELMHLQGEMASRSVDAIKDRIRTIKGVKVIAQKVAVDHPAALRDLADKFKDRLQSGIVVLGSVSGSKAFLIAIVTKDLTDRFHAGRIIKAAAAEVGGGGGGRPDMAQAGGTQPERLTAALESACETIETMSYPKR